MFNSRAIELNLLSKNSQPLAIYGAAGKGIVFSYACLEIGITNLKAIDNNSSKSGLYLEASGVPVFSITKAKSSLEKGVVIICMNPNHKKYVKEIFKGQHKVVSIGEISSIF